MKNLLKLLTPLAAVAASAATAPNLRVGIVSDTHVKGDKNKDLVWCRTAFERFRDAHVDAVIVPGDLVDDGQIEQLRQFAQTWRDVFPGDALPDGSHVEKFFIYGNHDSSSLSQGISQRNIKTATALWGEENAKDHLMAYHEKEMWEETFGEPWSPVYYKVVKGYVFVGCHWGHEKETAPWLEANAERLGLKSQKPWIYVQHPHPGGTVQSYKGEFAWGNDGGVATHALAGYPSAIALSGHSHYPLSDDQSIWQGEFTSVNCSSSAYLGRRDGRDNGEWENHGRKGRKVGPVPVAKGIWHGRHAMILEFSDDTFAFSRIDLLHGLPLGPAWTCPVPACVDDASRPYAFDTAAARSLPPQFAPGAADDIKITSSVGKDRSGKEGPIVSVSFPVAESSGPEGRVFEYEVTAENVGYGIVRIAEQKRILTTRIDDALELELANPAAREECLFRLDELPQEINVRFRIVPLNCFGVAGDPIYSKPMRFPLD